MNNDTLEEPGTGVRRSWSSAKRQSHVISRWIRRHLYPDWGAAALLLVVPALAQAQFTYTTNSGQITITGYTGSGGAVTVPSKINGYPVVGIAQYAFANNNTVTAFAIPGTVTSIGSSAFEGCTKLSGISVNPTNPAYCSTYDGVLFTKDQATLMAYPAAKIGHYTVPGTVTSIADEAFYDCTSLYGITLPSSLTSIGFEVFGYCSGLTSITIPASVTAIGSWTFFECGDLARAYFLGNPPTLGSGVFYNVSVTKVYYMPGTTGWGSTFGGCTALLWNPQVQTRDASFGVRGNQFGFNLAGTANIPIVIAACSDLANAGWTTLQSCTLTNGLIYFSDAAWTNYARRFYRISRP